MIKLVDHLARSRQLYPSPLISVPSVTLIEIDQQCRSSSLPLGRFYPIIIEANHELAELEAFLTSLRPEPVALSLLDDRPSALMTPRILISRYMPPQQGWRWIAVTCWLEAMAAAARDAGVSMARQRYTMELFEDSEALDDHCVALLHALSRDHDLEMRWLSPGGSRPPEPLDRHKALVPVARSAFARSVLKAAGRLCPQSRHKRRTLRSQIVLWNWWEADIRSALMG